MAKFTLFFIVAITLQAALCAPKKTQGTAGKNQIEEISTQVQNVVNEVSTSLKKMLPDTKQVTKVLTEQSNIFAKNIEDIIGKLQTEIDKNKGSADTVLKQVTEKLSENIGALKQAVGPDATAKANQIKTQLESHFKDSATEIEKLAKTVQPNFEQAGETISNFSKGILDDFLKAAQNLKTQVDNTIQNAQKSPKN